MSSAVSASPSVAKSPKKRPRTQSQRKTSGPTVSDRILKAASESEAEDMSVTILKIIMQAQGYDVKKNNTRINTAVKRLVAKKALIQTKGKGASGSFKINKKPPTPLKKKKVVKKKTPKVKRVKKATTPKPGATPGAKKTPRKKPNTPKKSKTPNKSKSPAAAKKPKNTKKVRVVKGRRTRSADKK